jgi:hypothetical protein
LNVHRIRRINCHPVESDEDSATGIIFDTDNWLIWNGDLEIPNDSKENCAADDDSDIEHNTYIEDTKCLELQDAGAAPILPGSVRPTRKSKRQAGKVVMMVNAVEMWRNKGGKKK